MMLMAETRPSRLGGVTDCRSVVVEITHRIGPAPSRKKLSPANSGVGITLVSAITTAAPIDSTAATPNAGAAPSHPTSAPPSAGPPAKATVRASSIRALAAGSELGGTSDGTSDGAATL